MMGLCFAHYNYNDNHPHKIYSLADWRRLFLFDQFVTINVFDISKAVQSEFTFPRKDSELRVHNPNKI